jgi:regulator of protease activity HflC (stomatin/prohibitin superfamily)
MITEIKAGTQNGYLMIVVLLAAQVLCGFLIALAPIFVKLIAILLFIIALICWFGLFIVAPNQGKILQLFGKYAGTEHTNGLRWCNPLYWPRKPISLRIRNFESGQLKVNDSTGNPIEIAAVIVWKVVDSAEAYFEVDNYESFVTIQSEAAIRNLANTYPYESHKDGELSLRGDQIQIAEKLKEEVQARLNKAGLHVIEARISHLAYAPEIAQVMLRKQQATAILAARRLIVKGAVEMVSDALTSLTQQHDFELDDERKASMVSNLLVVICSEQQTQPVINAGSLY